MLNDLTLSDTARFWSKVAIAAPDECWLWQARLDADGYGRIGVRGANRKAHRVSWAIANGRDPGSAKVLHSCDTPSCVNPHHLHLGTQADNIREMFQRGRNNTKLDPNKVRELRAAVASGESKASVSRRFGITRENVHWIVLRRQWAHVEEV